MNGKLILKRKREEQQLQQLQNAKRERFETEHEHHHHHQRPSVLSGQQSISATPPPSPPAADINCDPVIVPNTRNKILLEALQKIVELQKELDDFENDLDYNDEHGLPEEDDPEELSFYLDEQQQQMERQHQRHEAEALGFAMCARETLLFLQREGIPQDSPVYRTLREKLVGQVEEGIPI